MSPAEFHVNPVLVFLKRIIMQLAFVAGGNKQF